MAFSLTKPMTMLDAAESLELFQVLHALGFDAYNRANGGSLNRTRLVIERCRETAQARITFDVESSLGVSSPSVHPSSELTTRDAAKVLGRSEQRVTSLAKGGRLKARKVGRSWLIEASSLEALIEDRRRKGKRG